MSAPSLSLLVVVATIVAFTAPTIAIQTNSAVQRHLEKGTPLEWPALRFHFTIKKDTLKVYDQTSFDMYANPVVMDDNQNVLYDVYATFTQAKSLHNYTLVNGIAYSEMTPFSTGSSSAAPTPVVACLDTESGKLPAINSIVASVNEATAAANQTGNSSVVSTCATGSLYEMALNGANYTVCVSGTTGFTMQGSDMDVSVEYLESHIDIKAPTMEATAADKCSAMGLSSSVSDIGHSLLTGEPMPSGHKPKRGVALP